MNRHVTARLARTGTRAVLAAVLLGCFTLPAVAAEAGSGTMVKAPGATLYVEVHTSRSTRSPRRS